MNNLRFVFFCIFFLQFMFYLPSLCQEPLQISTETEDLSLTDDVNIARAQVIKYPDSPEAHFNLAIAFSRTSLVEEAIKELRKTKLLLRKKENEGLIDKKISEYIEMLKNHSRVASLNNVRYRLAFSYYLKAYLISKALEKEARLNRNNYSKNDLFEPDKLLLKYNNPQIKEYLDQCIFYFNDLLRIDPNDEWAKVYLAFVFAEQMGDITKAKTLWSEVQKNNPNNPAPYFFLGELHIKEGKLKNGFKEIAQALFLRSLGN